VTDYGDSNPLLMDYFGFSPELYNVQFESRGDAALSEKIVGMFKKVHNTRTCHSTGNSKQFRQHGIPARTTVKLEPRGRDGRGFSGPGLDHGMFSSESSS
jgi:hypothetical protein